MPITPSKLPIKKRISARFAEQSEQAQPLDLTTKRMRPNPPDDEPEQPATPVPVPTYRCDTCSHTFTALDRLRAHQRRHRIKESGKYTCGFCNKRFVQQSSLITHRRIHTGERPYECNVCHNRYGDLSTFTKHRRTHTGEKPYICLTCMRPFSQSGNCLRHCRTVHNIPEEELASAISSPARTPPSSEASSPVPSTSTGAQTSPSPIPSTSTGITTPSNSPPVIDQCTSDEDSDED